MAKMQALVIRAAGRPDIAGQIVRGLEASEIKRLKAEARALRKRDAVYWANKSMAAERAYGRVARPHSKIYKAFWGMVGMLVEMRLEARG